MRQHMIQKSKLAEHIIAAEPAFENCSPKQSEIVAPNEIEK